MQNEKVISIENMVKKFGDITVLDNINLDVNYGEVVSIIGPSGSGKSTLLRTIVDLEELTSGKIYIEEHEISDKNIKPNIKKEILLKTGMVFQNFNLFPHMKVGENIYKTLMVVKKISSKEAKEKAFKELERVGLEAKFDSYPSELSGGQKQRVAIARAMALNPDILLFDEPTSALDPELVKEVLDIIAKLRNEKITMIIVSHEMQFVREISDRVIVMETGRIIEQGSPEDIFINPKSKRVAEFLKV